MKRLMTVSWLGLAICLLLGTVFAYAEEEPVFVGVDQSLSMSAGMFSWTGVKEAVAGAFESLVQTAKDFIPGDTTSPVVDSPGEPTQFQIAWTNPNNAKYESQLAQFGLPGNLPLLSLEEQEGYIKKQMDYCYSDITDPVVTVRGNTYTQWIKNQFAEGGPGISRRNLFGANVWQLEYDARGQLDAVKISVQSYHYSPETGDQFPVIAEIITQRAPETS